jgi:GAF domain-containing protein
MLANATRLCDANFGLLLLYEGDWRFRVVAIINAPAVFAELRLREPIFEVSPETGLGRAVATKDVIHIADYAEEAIYKEQRHPAAVALGELGGARTFLVVPMLKDKEIAGAIAIYRQQVRPFTDKQIELVKNFAAQAVIAIENTRLLHELRQSLEQQTATAEVLRVINSSAGTLAPVFEAMLDKAMQLCEAAFGGMWTLEAGRYTAVALRGVPQPYAAFLAETTLVPGPGTAPYRFLHGERFVHNIDLASEEAYRAGDPQRRALVDLGGARTAVQVPLCKDESVLGVITIYRQEVRPFTDKQIELVQNFAAQAVIAIENTRLLNELRESLDRQTATADILRVIASTPEDSKHALDTIAETASHMFGVANVNFRRIEGDVLRIVSSAGPTIERLRKALPDIPLEATDPAVHCFLDNRQIPVEDRQAVLISEHGAIAAALRELPVRSQVFTPLSLRGKAIGVMIVTRGEVQPFQQSDLDLMKGFADQAVIAIENARLLNELRERTEEVLKLNQQLEQRVTDQVGEIERMGRLRRFLPPQVADLIVASGMEKQLE